MKIGDRIYVHGYVDEIRKDCVIIHNDGGYFGTVKSEIVEAQKTEDIVSVIRCMDCKFSSPNQAYGCRIHSFADDLDKRMYAYDFCSMAERKEK